MSRTTRLGSSTPKLPERTDRKGKRIMNEWLNGYNCDPIDLEVGIIKNDHSRSGVSDLKRTSFRRGDSATDLS